MPKRQKSNLLFWLILLPLALALRVWAAAKAFAPNFDSATPGLMALDILSGERLPLMFYGQAYFGAMEAYVSAFWIAWLGASDLALALGPITTSIAWLLTLHALVRRLAGPRAALGAAAIAAFPGWGILWFNLTSLGGYPATWWLGTLSWLLALRVAQRDRPAGQSILAIALLGLVTGLAIWVNFQSAPLLAMAALTFAPWFWRHRKERGMLPALLAGGVCFLLMILPILLLAHDYTGMHTASWNPAPAKLFKHAGITLTKALPPVLFGPARTPLFIGCTLLLLFAGATLYTRWVRTAESKSHAPWILVGIFLLLFLPHPMSAEGGSRYLITPLLWTLFAIFAWPLEDSRPRIRHLAATVWGAWVLLHLIQGIASAEHSSERRNERVRKRENAVASAQSISATHVELVGGYIYGHEGQVLTWAAKNDVFFSSVLDERRIWLAQDVEAMDQPALGCSPALYYRLRRTLASMGYDAKRAQQDPVSFFWDFSGDRNPGHGFVPATGKRMTGEKAGVEAPEMLDRIWESYVEGSEGEGIWLDLGREVALERLWLCEPNPYQGYLPMAFAMEASRDGESWRDVLHCQERFASGYGIEDRVYVGGFMGQMELHLDGQKSRYLRMRVLGTRKHTDGKWRIGEVLALESKGPFPKEEPNGWDRDGVIEAIARTGAKMVFADRWLSARLMGDARFEVLQRFNSKYIPSQRTRIPVVGDAILVSDEIADETATVLEGVNVRFDRTNVRRWTLLHLRDVPEKARMYWTGHRLLYLQGDEPRGY